MAGQNGIGRARGVEWFADNFERLRWNIESFLRGKPDVVQAALTCLFAEGHLLIEDVPGVGKTSLAMAIARSIDARMGRIQFTPDLLPSDVTGIHIYNREGGIFRFVEGPIFADVVLADEINRASPKTQSALLEVMEERQVTVDGVTKPFGVPFVVLATSNPVEHEGVYRLPEAQLDRFMMRISVGYPSIAAECEVVDENLRGRTAAELDPILSVEEVRDMIATARTVEVSPAVQEYVVRLAAATREDEDCELGVSPRASVALASATRAAAAAARRSFVTVDDVKVLAGQVFAHRIVLRPEAERSGVTAGSIVDRLLRSGVTLPHEARQ